MFCGVWGPGQVALPRTSRIQVELFQGLWRVHGPRLHWPSLATSATALYGGVSMQAAYPWRHLFVLSCSPHLSGSRWVRQPLNCVCIAQWGHGSSCHGMLGSRQMAGPRLHPQAPCRSLLLSIGTDLLGTLSYEEVSPTPAQSHHPKPFFSLRYERNVINSRD
jgi:hypothetical protein